MHVFTKHGTKDGKEHKNTYSKYIMNIMYIMIEKTYLSVYNYI